MAFPAAGTFEVPATPGDFTVDDFEVPQEAFLAATKQLIGAATRTELTLSAGIIVPTIGSHTVDTEAGAATDDLTNIQYTNFEDGAAIVLWPENAARVVTLKHLAGGVGQISVLTEVDLELTIPVVLQRHGSVWYEMFHGEGVGVHIAILATIATLGRWLIRAAGGSITDDYTGGYAGGTSGYNAMLVTQTAPASMKVAVAAGLFAIDNVPYTFIAAGDSAVMTAPNAQPRIDKICLDTDETIQITTGAEAGSPVTPATPAGQFALATIYHRVGETSIKTVDDTVNGYVYTDERHFFN